MSWLFSQALVAAFSEATCSDGEPLPQLSVMPTQHPFWRNVKPMDVSGHSLFGLTLNRLTADRGAELLTWYLAGFPVRTLASPEVAQDSMESAADCGRTWPALLAKYDPSSHTLKTAQGLLFSDLTESFVTLPRSGSMRNGVVYQQPTLARPMIVTGCGSSQGTEKFPTPTVCGNYNRKGASATSGDGLATYVKKYPTPTATAYKGWSKNHNRANTDDRLDYTVEREAHESGTPGRLNPMWEEWLMAWPIGWTQLSPLGMDKWEEWQQQHSPSYAPVADGHEMNQEAR